MVVRLRLLAALVLGLAVLAACGTPTPPVTEVELSVTLAGTGSGTVTSNPAGIDTGAGTLAADFDEGTVVTLTATAAAGSTFTGFTGATCGAGSTATTCVVTLDADTVVTATFDLVPPQPTLDVVLAGDGDGDVTSDPAGIDTGAGQASAAFASGTVVTLTAAPDADNAFIGFTGVVCEAGSTATTCIVTVTTDTTVTATFEPTATLTVAIATAGGADGSVTSDPAGIDTAGGFDAETFLVGTTVTLTAQVDAGGFAGWTGGDCDGLKTLVCDVVVGAGEPGVTANFNAVQTIAVTVAANGDDAVEFLSDSSSSPANNPAGWVWANWQRFDLGFDPNHTQTEVGLRFPSVALPAGANVLEAVLQVSRYDLSGGSSGAFDLAVRGQLATSAAGFPQDPDGAPSANITGRIARTTASATWSIASGAWVADQAYQSSDLAAVVQEIVDLPTWSLDSVVVLFLSNANPANTESRRVWSFDGVGAADPRVPTLLIDFVALPTP